MSQEHEAPWLDVSPAAVPVPDDLLAELVEEESESTEKADDWAEATPRDEHGHWTTGGGGGGKTHLSLSGGEGPEDEPVLIARMEQAAHAGGGFTFDAKGGTPTEGLAVAVFPKRSGTFDAKTVGKAQIQAWLDANRSVAKDHRLMVGGWVDEKGVLWLDLVRVYRPTDRDLAIRMGVRLNQKAIADLGAIYRGDWDHAFINTGGTGEAKAAPAKGTGRSAMFLFPATVTADEILAAVQERVGKAEAGWQLVPRDEHGHWMETDKPAFEPEKPGTTTVLKPGLVRTEMHQLDRAVKVLDPEMGEDSDDFHANVGQEHIEHRAELDKATRKIIAAYQDTAHDHINHYLRGTEDPRWEPQSDAIDDWVETLSDAIRGAPEVAQDGELVVWRGSKAKWATGLRPGDVIEDQGFVSTSVDYGAARQFAEAAVAVSQPPVIYRIRLPEGTRGMYLAGKNGKYESEVLLQRNSRFQVTRVVKAGKAMAVELLYLGSKTGSSVERVERAMRMMIAALRKFDESKHPRDPGGEDGGQFIPAGTSAAGAEATPERTSSLKDRPSEGFNYGSWRTSFESDQGKTIEEWKKVPLPEKMRLANPTVTIDARIKDHLGDTPWGKPSGDTKADVHARFAQFESQIHPESLARGVNLIGGMHDAFIQSGVSPEAADKMTRHATDALLGQEMESQTRLLGDHGIAHLAGDASFAVRIASQIPGKPLEPRDIAQLAVTSVYHDAGYMTPPVRAGLQPKHPEYSADRKSVV